MSNKPKKIETRSKYERKRERTAVILLTITMLPVVYIYGRFFINAFINQTTGAFTFGNFEFMFHDIILGQAKIQAAGVPFRNTVLFTIVVTLCEVVFSCMAGYALAKMEFVGKKTITFSLLILRMFPGVLLLIGILYILMYIHVVNTLFGVVIVAIALRLPGSTFIIRNFFAQIPRDIENSALIDGCNKLTSFFQVIIHMVKPGIASISLFSFMAAWSNYLLFNVLIFSSKTPVLATYLRTLSLNEQMIADYGVFSAIALIYMLPVVIFFLVSQRQLMKGSISGGKGI